MTAPDPAGLREALDAYRANPVNVDDTPESWALLWALLDACDAALDTPAPRDEFTAQDWLDIFDRTADRPAIRAKVRARFATDTGREGQ